MTQRADIYANMDTTFLRDLAENINLSFRSHADSDKETLVNLLDKKISLEKADTVFKLYLACYPAKDVAKAIKPKGMEELANSVEKYFKHASASLYEVTVGEKRCDVVFFIDNEIVAIEIKSAQDQMKNALSQLNYYAKWANKVFLAYDSKHSRVVETLNLAEKGIGRLEFEKGKMKCLNDAVTYQKNTEQILPLMTYDYLLKIAKTAKIETKGTKEDIAKRLVTMKPTAELMVVFKNYLRSRSLR